MLATMQFVKILLHKYLLMKENTFIKVTMLDKNLSYTISVLNYVLKQTPSPKSSLIKNKNN